jgi:hypothetical protein
MYVRTSYRLASVHTYIHTCTHVNMYSHTSYRLAYVWFSGTCSQSSFHGHTNRHKHKNVHTYILQARIRMVFGYMLAQLPPYSSDIDTNRHTHMHTPGSYPYGFRVNARTAPAIFKFIIDTQIHT